MRRVQVSDFFVGGGEELAIMSGPCVIESEIHTLRAAERLRNMFQKNGVRLIFKSSYDKANRSSHHSFRGPGLEEGLRILERVRKEFSLPVVTDVHSPEEARAAAEVCEVIQIPAFLCRQTDLLRAAAETGAVVNVKKGQFMAPWDMGNVVEKIRDAGNNRLILTERGASFGYNNLVTDFRAIPEMQRFGFPVYYDATHSVQKPGSLGNCSGGEREYILLLARAALAVGVDGLFLESHDAPAQAKSDAATVLDFDSLERALPRFRELYHWVRMES